MYKEWIELYLFCGVVWAINASHQQVACYGRGQLNLLLSTFFNILVWPFAILFSLYCEFGE